jgi:hypothetical protein
MEDSPGKWPPYPQRDAFNAAHAVSALYALTIVLIWPSKWMLNKSAAKSTMITVKAAEFVPRNAREERLPG